MRSMTGFSRLSEGDDFGQWLWEMRCVNGKGLDLRIRVPQGYEDLDPKIRDISRKYLFRGNCNFSLNLKKIGGDKVILLNEAALKSAAQASQKAGSLLGLAPSSLESLLQIKGVLELVEPEEDAKILERNKQLVIEGFEVALQSLVEARAEEGRRLALLFEDYLKQIKTLVQSAEKSLSRSPEKIRQRLERNLAQLLIDKEGALDKDRLYQEAIVIAMRADIEEEIKRLYAHIEAAFDLLKQDGAVGRKFDFLIQEFNREANTLCSKANADDITKIGLSLKVIIDQMREQVQNIE